MEEKMKFNNKGIEEKLKEIKNDTIKSFIIDMTYIFSDTLNVSEYNEEKKFVQSYVKSKIKTNFPENSTQTDSKESLTAISMLYDFREDRNDKFSIFDMRKAANENNKYKNNIFVDLILSAIEAQDGDDMPIKRCKYDYSSIYDMALLEAIKIYGVVKNLGYEIIGNSNER